jgi:hypothetical protein
MHQHYSEVLGEIISQVIAPIGLGVVQPNRWLVLVGLELVGQEDAVIRAIVKLEKFAAGAAETGLEERQIRLVPAVRPLNLAAAAEAAVAAAAVALVVVAAAVVARVVDVTLQT